MVLRKIRANWNYDDDIFIALISCLPYASIKTLTMPLIKRKTTFSFTNKSQPLIAVTKYSLVLKMEIWYNETYASSRSCICSRSRYKLWFMQSIPPADINCRISVHNLWLVWIIIYWEIYNLTLQNVPRKLSIPLRVCPVMLLVKLTHTDHSFSAVIGIII